MTALGWSHGGGQPIIRTETQWIWNDPWGALGNVGLPIGDGVGVGSCGFFDSSGSSDSCGSSPQKICGERLSTFHSKLRSTVRQLGHALPDQHTPSRRRAA